MANGAQDSKAQPGSDPWTAEPPQGAARIDLLSLVPLVSIVALLTLVVALVWLINRSDVERARTKLATDALWVEQTLRFQLSVDEDMLVRLAQEGLGGTAPEVLETRARLHISANPEVLSVIWYDTAGAVLHAVPGRSIHGVSVRICSVIPENGSDRFLSHPGSRTRQESRHSVTVPREQRRRG